MSDSNVKGESRRAFWKSGTPPEWASDWGWDECGAWAEFSIDADSDVDNQNVSDVRDAHTITQRLRWIPPGTFLMGSPEYEPQRWDPEFNSEYEDEYDFEGPQHQVTITQEFWMFDTQVTQELWQAVKDNNPSHFKGPRRPVEQVSWDDCQEFLQRMRELLKEASFDLPTEAQWEYA